MKLVVLDRDGVINEDSDDYIKSPAEWIAIPGSLEAIARLNHYGYKVAIATNQSGLARHLFTIDTLNAIHQKMRADLERVGGQIDGIFFCPHGPDDDCNCRKPKSGLMAQIKERFGVDLTEVQVVGDSLRDLQAAQKVGAQPILVRTGKGERTLKQHASDLEEIPVFSDLSAVVDCILEDCISNPNE